MGGPFLAIRIISWKNVEPSVRLQRLDARRLLVVHDEGTVVQLRDAGVELAQELEHERLVGLLLLLVEPAGLVVRVELVIGRIQLANLIVESLQSHVVVDHGDARSSPTVDELALPQWTGKEIE